MVATDGAVTVVIVDDHSALRQGLQVLLERRACRVLAAVGTAAEGEQAIAEHSPDVAVIDVGLPDEGGVRLTRRLLLADPGLRIVIYTGIEDAPTLAAALESGARGFVFKPSPLDTLLDAIRTVRRGKRYIDPRISALVDDESSELPRLSRREREVFDLLAEGLSGEQIAERLFLSPETVRTHIRNAMAKLEARTRAEAVLKAFQRHEIGEW